MVTNPVKSFTFILWSSLELLYLFTLVSLMVGFKSFSTIVITLLQTGPFNKASGGQIWDGVGWGRYSTGGGCVGKYIYLELTGFPDR